MLVVIIADTHMPRRAKKLPEKLKEDLRTADLILHAGDWQTLDVLEELKSFAPVDGVAGNVDNEEITNKFGKKKIFDLDGTLVGLTHGDGKGKTTEKRAIEQFAGDEIDILIYGHSHIPVKKEMDNFILFNPGSPTDKRRQDQYSYGLLKTGNNPTLEHVFFQDKS
ncbi:metallophosphoesterase family protein [Sediminibacillus massiliensis]|uniref:metallophosphoesterase family protein n=1 Tax=Sediminibacillus massiliensis TaxID=1926277 RepID=UPI0009887BD3|nr:metallophosphoesterase family protein [Sediminibacillus massiliensis]